ncbi:uncharacterized protein LOC126464487 isoform X2 [Schistocerca serialis cubense]|uniref:uncharacterized protein LOC126464487 isoform X2 n=1 Tax=Schistocerca serialis cubense TaxID=2023355 RepID=UPI00214E9F3E|nr:uncharacterized protein LOC126464487 isoform X2 [Schistocerca serialis cubense]
MPKLNMKWGTEQIIRFLDIYAMHRCLWDFNDADYKNKQQRAAALEAILRDLNMDGLTMPELQTKIHSIRNTYTNELRKMEASKSSSCGTDRIYKTKIPWFELADSFLREIVYKRKNYTNLVPVHTPGLTSSEQTSSSSFAASSKKVMMAPQSHDRFIMPTRYLEAEDDEFLTLAKGYAVKLRKLTPQQLMFADKVINDTLLDAQMGLLTRGSYVVHSSGILATPS